jgi:hypothetical protein
MGAGTDVARESANVENIKDPALANTPAPVKSSEITRCLLGEGIVAEHLLNNRLRMSVQGRNANKTNENRPVQTGQGGLENLLPP